MRNYLNKLFYTDKWNIGYVHQSAQDFIARRQLDDKVVWLKESKADYAADPFVFVHRSEVHVYYEELTDVLSKGRINVISGLDFSTKKRVKGFKPKDIHLSYPYIFDDQEHTYCIPETGQAKEVALYEIDANDLSKIKKMRVLLNGKSYVDTSIIFYKQKFWLFTSVSGKPNVFYIYYADSLDNEFISHAQNPIETDNKNFRNAGNLFIVGDQLYRPTQNMELVYGGSVVINQVIELSETTFASKVLFEVKPKAPYSIGLHNISMLDHMIVFDGKRSFFSSTVGIKKILKKLIGKSASIYINVKAFLFN
ncbi:hypothetical protein [Pedobacter sp. ASV28]|jgi:hypothetical protein|uniref:glucosamine inositolphosphorylceramide transferase family protein n=1 Tax=Pedobacter sp. ASV28 TaxID=2795123 RepID=UPI0018EADF6A|nr:hypothetical protein [Pedobacter sp. ASV28]